MRKLFIYKETTAIPCPCNKWHLGYWDTLKHICSLPQVLGALLPFSKSPKAKKHLENGSLNGLSKCHASQEYYVSYLLFNETSVKILSYHHAFTPPLDTLNSRVYIAERWYKHWNRTYLLETFAEPGELNQSFGIQFIAESRLKENMSTYLFASSSSCPSFISVLPLVHLYYYHVKHVQTLGWHYPYNQR